MDEFYSGDLIKRFGVTNETIRTWAAKYKDFLSPGANPVEKGSHRRFTFADLEVLTLVYEMREENHSWDDIAASLAAGSRGVPVRDPAALLPLEGQKQLAMLYGTIEQLRGQAADLEAKLTASNTRADRAEGVRDNLEKLLAAANEKITTLSIELDKQKRE